MLRKLILISTSLLLTLNSVSSAEEIILKDPVTDLTGTLSSSEQESLRGEIRAFEAETGSQIAVLIVASTKPNDIAPYANKVFNATQLGRKGIDDGVLLFVAKEDRQVRIEVGRGLEGAIPDITAWRIISEEILPRFKQGDFFHGMQTGVRKIITVASGEPLPPPNNLEKSNIADSVLPLVFFGVILGSLLATFFGKRTGSFLSSLGVGLFGLTMLSIVGSLILTVIVYALTRLLLALEASSTRWGGGNMHIYRGGNGSGGGLGGGWSGGGGFSSGGGASGSW